MEQQFSPEQQQFLMTQLSRYIEQLTSTIQNAISATEAEANTAFTAQGMVFSAYSPANVIFRRRVHHLTPGLLAAGVSPMHLYEDYAFGKIEDRPGLMNCLKALREGDTLVVWKSF